MKLSYSTLKAKTVINYCNGADIVETGKKILELNGVDTLLYDIVTVMDHICVKTKTACFCQTLLRLNQTS